MIKTARGPFRRVVGAFVVPADTQVFAFVDSAFVVPVVTLIKITIEDDLIAATTVEPV